MRLHTLIMMNGTVFDVRELTKVYRMGEVEIHALRQVSLVLGRVISSCCSGRRR